MNFTITATPAEHGTIIPSGGMAVLQGSDKTFTINPYSGYVITDVLVDGVSVGPVTTYTFTDVQAAHRITVTFNSVPFDPVQFRLDFPEFTDLTKYPASMINFWSGMADTMLNIRRWGDLRPYGLALFVAHNLALAAMTAASGVAGATPGFGIGLTTSESAGPISHSMDYQTGAIDGGANWNLTWYGVKFLYLSRIVGTGGLQV